MKKAAYLCFLLISSLVTAAAAQALPIAMPNCTDHCGDVSIPFPWGIGRPGCFLDNWFEIECRQVGPTKIPFLAKLGLQVYALRLEPTLFILIMPPVNTCTANTTTALDLRGSPYAFSADENVFVMEGCSASAILVDKYSNTSNSIDAGCATICRHNNTNNTVVQPNNCVGVNCCQSPLPYDLKSYQPHFYRQSAGADKLGRQNCLLASLIMRGYLEREARNLSSSVLPAAALVALTWSWISNTPPGFNPNTAICFFFKLGWRCSCLKYIEGRSNPYVYGGCPDSGECQGCSSPLKFLTSTTALIVYACLGIAIRPLFLVFGCRWVYRFTKRRRKAEKRVKTFKLMLQAHQSSNTGNMESTKLFSHKELDKATEHFNDNRVLGKGGQGTVYKGMLTDGRIVAVKKSVQIDETQMEQFINEVVILSQTNHRNVVKLLGCCLETEVPLLAYEYISNGTLHQHLHDPSEGFVLCWAVRLKIAVDSAGAIAYLHSSSSNPVYHRDIKSANILLDDKYRAKVSDFGCSKTIEIDQTHLTTLVQGTMGYLDPEYFESSIFTEKSDVYSFGVVMLELLTSKKPIFRNERMEQKGLVSEFFLQMQNHSLSNILDPEVVKEAKDEEITAYAGLAKQCLNECGRLRPAMKEVEMTLEMIIKSSTETHARDNRAREDKGFDEIVMFEMSDTEFISSSSRIVPPNSLYIDVEPLLRDSI